MTMVHARFIRIPAVALLAALIPAASSPMSGDELPATEWEARQAVRQGALDSLLYETIRPWYAQPLHVSMGELTYLAGGEALLDKEDLPSRAQIERFEPWSDSTIEAFFISWPELARFRPILSFRSHPGPHIGQANVTSAIGGGSRNTIRLTVNPVSQAAFHGTIALDSSRARWGYRSLRARARQYASAAVGNYAFRFTDRLSYGYFPSERRTPSVADNWKYGSSHTWNGALLESGALRGCDFSMLYHERQTEQVVGGLILFSPGAHLNIGAGGSRLVCRDQTADSIIYLHAKSHFRHANWRVALYGDAALSRPDRLAIRARLRRRYHRSWWRLHLQYLPAKYRGPRSARVHRVCGKVGFGDTLLAAAASVDIAMRQSLSDAWSVSSSAEHIAAGARAWHAASVRIHMRARMDFSCAYSFWKRSYEPDAHHRMIIRTAHAIGSSLELTTKTRGAVSNSGETAIAARLACDWHAAPAMSFHPALSVAAKPGDVEAAVYIGQKLTLFNECGGSYEIRMPVGRNASEVRFSAQSDFAF
jgi:hypothetical protein